MKLHLTLGDCPGISAIVLLIVSLFLIGCEQKAPQKEIRVQTPVGKSGQCDNCDTNIANVTEDNLMTYQAIQYIVCSDKCADELKEKLASQ